MMAQMLFTCRTVSICLPDGEWCSSLVLGGHVTLCKQTLVLCQDQCSLLPFDDAISSEGK